MQLAQQRAALSQHACDVLEQRPRRRLEQRERVVEHVAAPRGRTADDADVLGRERRHGDGVGEVAPRPGVAARFTWIARAAVPRELGLDEHVRAVLVRARVARTYASSAPVRIITSRVAPRNDRPVPR